MKGETSRLWIGAWAIMLIAWIITFTAFTITYSNCQSQPENTYNHYAGDYECERNCGRYNSTGIHGWSYIDNKWHCSCEQDGEVVLLW